MNSKYVDTKAVIQVIGSIYQNNSLLDNEKYKFNAEDFPTDFHKVMFGSIYNLHELGAENINVNTIEDYLEQRPKKLAIYKAYKGDQWLNEIEKTISVSTFDYYYTRLKKFTLLRMYNKIGVDISYLYSPDTLDIKKRQKQEDWLDNTPIEDIADKINEKIERIKALYVANISDEIGLAGDGQDELLDQLMATPNVGYPLYGRYINKIFRGARLGTFFLRSAPTNMGKTRAMIADTCFIGCDEIYDPETKKWIPNGSAEPTMFISTEQKRDEIQTMMWSFISGVPEDHILENEYYGDELDRVRYAIQILKRCPVYIKELPDFSLQDIEAVIKLGIKKYKIKYVMFDYIHSSMKILSEVSGKANIKGLREDNVLFMISVRLKDIAAQYSVFLLSSTQLNGDYIETKTYDQNLLRGAKAIADKVDAGMIILPVMDEDRKALEQFCNTNGYEMPTAKISIYKNRRGRYNHIFLWCTTDLGICRINPIFATSYFYEPIEIEDLVIKIKEAPSAF